MPSLFVSTVEKLGDVVVPDVLPDDEDGVLDGVLLDDEDGVDEEDDGEDVEDDWATASVDSAKSTAALRMLRVLGIT